MCCQKGVLPGAKCRLYYNVLLPATLAAAVLVSVTNAKQVRLQELLDASRMLTDMPSLVDPVWMSAGIYIFMS
jgi:hypothetical protein